MRHLKSGRALGVKPAHRRAMLRNLVTSVLEHERITTTMARAKELRGPLDKMITLGKRGDLNARRRALAYVKSKKAMEVLFGDLAQRYADRPGGFARVLRTAVRRGDGAEMAIVQWVGAPNEPFAEAANSKGKRGGRGGKGKQGEATAKAPTRRKREAGQEEAAQVVAAPAEEETQQEAAPAEEETQQEAAPATEAAAPAEEEAKEEAPPAEEEAPPKKKS